jgi:WD repeat-containing protein 19
MSGRVIGVSTHMAEIGTEIFNIQDHSEFCTSMKLTKDLSKLATSGEDSIRIHSSNNLKVVDSIIPIGQGFMIRIFKGVGEDN